MPSQQSISSSRKNLDALSEGSDLSDEAALSSDEDMVSSNPRTPSKRRRKAFRIALDDDSDDEIASDSDGAVGNQYDDENDFEDELQEEEDDDDGDFRAPVVSTGVKRKPGRPSKASLAAAAAAASSATPKRGARSSARSSQAGGNTESTPPASSGKKTLKVKLTRTPTSAAKQQAEPTPPPLRVQKQQAKAAPAKKAQAKTKARGSKGGKHSDSDDDRDDYEALNDDNDLLLGQDDGEPEEEEEDELDASRAVTADPEDDDDQQLSGLDNSSGDESEPDEATAAEMVALAGRTARQLARDSGGDSASHVQLPMFDPNRKKKLTENELALRRSETARKRKNHTEKKLEDDKIETINRLLKKQVGRSRNKLPRAGSAEESDEEAEKAKQKGREQVSRKALKHMPAPFFRTVERADFKVLAVPTGPPYITEILPPNYVSFNTRLIQELDTAQPKARNPKLQALNDKNTHRFKRQKQEWDEEQTLQDTWGTEGLYEYKLRKALGQTRQQWIGSRAPPESEDAKEVPAEEPESAQDDQSVEV